VLGGMLRDGLGIERDIEEAIDWFELAAAQNDNHARAALARLFFDGRDVPLDLEKAAKFAAATYAGDENQASLPFTVVELVRRSLTETDKRVFFDLFKKEADDPALDPDRIDEFLTRVLLNDSTPGGVASAGLARLRTA